MPNVSAPPKHIIVPDLLPLLLLFFFATLAKSGRNNKYCGPIKFTTSLFTLLSCEDVQEYSMSTPWDITTSSLLNSYSTTAQDNNPEGIDFDSTGTKYFIVGKTGDKVYEYSMSTAWDISTSSYTSREFSVASQTTDPSSVRFGNSGAKMYVMRKDSRVYQYTTASTYSGTVRSSVI